MPLRRPQFNIQNIAPEVIGSVKNGRVVVNKVNKGLEKVGEKAAQVGSTVAKTALGGLLKGITDVSKPIQSLANETRNKLAGRSTYNPDQKQIEDLVDDSQSSEQLESMRVLIERIADKEKQESLRSLLERRTRVIKAKEEYEKALEEAQKGDEIRGLGP